ncbi:MAG: DNA adenine methylase [Oscillospiraceae bacterium]|nr:DNA adenine methylase [Oscillospiraceae bacterium]
MRNNLVMPVLKWAGGKRQLLDTFQPLLPSKITSYCEPFLGGGALLFHLQPQRAIINDINEDLIRVYRVIRDDVEALIAALENHANTAEHFYTVRSWDRDSEFYNSLSDIEKAARTIYLNKTCYNGLYRVNNSGHFNTPFGNYKKANIVNSPVLRAVSEYLNSADIEISSCDYAAVLHCVPQDTFVYLDPPYDPLTATASFTSYSKGGFTREDQIRLRECCDALDRRGIRFMLSNSATDFILEQWAAYNITVIEAKRSVNSVSSGRGPVNEVVVRNYE